MQERIRGERPSWFKRTGGYAISCLFAYGVNVLGRPNQRWNVQKDFTKEERIYKFVKKQIKEIYKNDNGR